MWKAKKSLYGLGCLLLCLTSASISVAQNDTGYVALQYFGLAVAYPDSVGIFSAEGLSHRTIKGGPVGAILTIDQKGKVKQIEYAPDSANYFKLIEKKIKKIRFNFNPGRELGFPQKIPLTVQYIPLMRGEFSVRLAFPVDHTRKADTILLADYFELNNVTPPRIKSLRPIFHIPLGDTSQIGCPVVRVVARLDERGFLTDLIYPESGVAIPHHYIHTALMGAEFEPAIIKGEAIAIDLPLIFRLFDNLDYPFSPINSATPADTAKPDPITAAHFITPVYNPVDLSLLPLPRKYPNGYIHSAPLGNKIYGNFKIQIGLDSLGRVNALSIPRTTPENREIVRKAIKLIRWYPALDSAGIPVRFSGKITLHFDKSPQIVYNAEWLKP